MSPSSQCAHCECRLDVNRPAHMRGCLGDSRNYEECEECRQSFHKREMIDELCGHCAAVRDGAYL